MATQTEKQKQKKKSDFLKKVEEFKDYIQQFIAFNIVALLAIKLLYRFLLVDLDFFPDSFHAIEFLKLPTLEIVGKALAYSAGVDLAFMLLTPGPDEAIQPLILGLASAILFSISKIEEPKIELALEIGLYVLVLAGLFVMKEFFIKEDKESYFWKTIANLKK